MHKHRSSQVQRCRGALKSAIEGAEWCMGGGQEGPAALEHYTANLRPAMLLPACTCPPATPPPSPISPPSHLSSFPPPDRVHDNVHDDMNMSLIMHDHKPVHSYDQHIIPHDQ